MYADSTTTLLLTIPKQRRANQANRNNVALSRYMFITTHRQKFYQELIQHNNVENMAEN